ncbi:MULTISPECIES: hypothetical protein [unclassified Mesorhizobium]|uniref:hypothetical protein n=1 Tax=unclassified Mesorhizobium TaxID=325217 RepID=UPI0030150F73
MPNITVRAAAEGLPSINRRIFLRGTAALGAMSATVAAPAFAAEPETTIHERAIWHMRELERLAVEDGAGSAMVMVVGRPCHGQYKGFKTMLIDHHGNLRDDDSMFVEART